MFNIDPGGGAGERVSGSHSDNVVELLVVLFLFFVVAHGLHVVAAEVSVVVPHLLSDFT